jgi:hypothetical protein
MTFSGREAWTAIHGMVFGFGFLLFYTGALVLMITLRSRLLTPDGVDRNVALLKTATTLMAVLSWLAVFVGTYIAYPWYRATPPAGTTDLTSYARSLLLSSPAKASWHNFGMEWKEHVAWISPILATAVTAVVWRYGKSLKDDLTLNWTLVVTTLASFGTAAVAGILGALITKAAPVL